MVKECNLARTQSLLRPLALTYYGHHYLSISSKCGCSHEVISVHMLEHMYLITLHTVVSISIPCLW